MNEEDPHDVHKIEIKLNKELMKTIIPVCNIGTLVLISGVMASNVNIGGNFIDFWLGAVSLVLLVAAAILTIITIVTHYDRYFNT